ncbi:Uncharacterised protein [Mycobacteroides abscessus subsp. massiliense]|nr:Uncharacterised protein [Mycobacteroides abscessus subsp. massiliense]
MTTNYPPSVWLYPHVNYLPFDPLTVLQLRVMADYSSVRADLDALMVSHCGY